MIVLEIAAGYVLGQFIWAFIQGALSVWSKRSKTDMALEIRENVRKGL